MTISSDIKRLGTLCGAIVSFILLITLLWKGIVVGTNMVVGMHDLTHSVEQFDPTVKDFNAKLTSLHSTLDSMRTTQKTTDSINILQSKQIAVNQKHIETVLRLVQKQTSPQ